MEVRKCNDRTIVYPSYIPGIRYEIGPYFGCEHRCRYCYIFNESDAAEFDQILVHKDLAARLRNELSALDRDVVLIGRDTDPYQSVESRYRHTRTALEILGELGFPASVLTKSDAVVEDLDLLVRMPGSSVGTSLAFNSEQTREWFEESAPSNHRRVMGLKASREAGIETYALISPVFPYITDVPALIESVAEVADTIWIYRLAMNSADDANWRATASVIQDHFPHLADKFRTAAFAKDHSYWSELKRQLGALGSKRLPKMRIEI